jgi:hypothetical protein
MKPIFAWILLASLGLGLAGCESDLPPDPNAQNKIERGMSGRGTLTTPDKADDPLIRDSSNSNDYPQTREKPNAGN